VRNIFVWVGICARNSIISLHRYDRANARRRTPQLRAYSNALSEGGHSALARRRPLMRQGGPIVVGELFAQAVACRT
jgi:hypothetical protein